MDTWATSSVSPQIVCGYETDADLFARTFPMDLRPQAHDIIRTWLFSSVVRSHLEHGSVPWRHAAISGWVLDPDRKKMSKSKGNVVTPLALLEEYGSDGVRYWAARGGPGVDTAFDVGQMKIGRRLAIKLLNASKFALSGGVTAGGEVTHPLDRGMLTDLAALVEEATAALDEYEYTRALDRTEAFFWSFCDNYLELVKSRRYGDQGPEAAASATRAMQAALSVMLRLFAPYLPFVTEEVWSWWHDGSVHRAPWPAASDLAALAAPDAEAAASLAVTVDVLGEVRRVRSEAKRPLKAVIAGRWCATPRSGWRGSSTAALDLSAAANMQTLMLEEAPELSVQIEFADPATPAADPSSLRDGAASARRVSRPGRQRAGRRPRGGRRHQPRPRLLRASTPAASSWPRARSCWRDSTSQSRPSGSATPRLWSRGTDRTATDASRARWSPKSPDDARAADRGADRPQLSPAPERHRDRGAPLRRRRRRPHHRPRHPQDHADVARAGEIRRALRRRHESSAAAR